MAISDYFIRFRMLSDEALEAKRVSLEEEESFYASQSMGNKSFQKNIFMIQDMLNAIAYIQRERNPPPVASRPNGLSGTIDFSRI